MPTENKNPSLVKNSNQPKPILNASTIKNSTNIWEARLNTKDEIEFFLKTNNLTTASLPKDYQNWEAQIKNLKSKEELTAFVQQMEKSINEESKEQQSSKQPKGLSMKSKLGIGIGTSLGIVFLILILIRKKKLTLSKKQN